MSVKEIRELDEEVKEISVEDGVADKEDWEETPLDTDDQTGRKDEEEEESEEFSIGDTMLARGEAVESWGAKSLEDTISDEDFEEDFESEDFEDEEEDEGGFSYEAVGGDDVGDLYGATTSSGDLYGGRDASVGDLYGVTKREDSVSMYNTGGGSASESSMYNVNTGKKNDRMTVSYQVEGPKKKKKAVRRGPKSGLEVGINKKRRSKGVSLY